MKTSRWIVFGVILLATRFCEAQLASDLLSRLAPMPPCSSVQAAARERGIPLDGIDPAVSTNGLSPGDAVTMLITLHEKNQCTQWILYLQATNISAEPPAKKAKPLVLYTCTGNRFEFTNSPAAIILRTIGPFPQIVPRWQHPLVKDERVQVKANMGYLGLGLDRATAAYYRFSNLRRLHPEYKKDIFTVREEAFSSSQISRGQKMAAAMQITREEERALAGGIPALFSYFGTVQQTPGLDTIMFSVVSLPSMWSMVKNCGITAGLEFASGTNRLGPLSLPSWNLPSPAPFYSLPMELTLNDRPALELAMIVTAPCPPLLACGGIVGFLAENPNDEKNYLTLRVISARYGAGPPPK